MCGLWWDLYCLLCSHIFIRVYRNILYFVSPYPCHAWQACWQASHSFLVTVLSPKSNTVILLLINLLGVEFKYSIVVSYRTCMRSLCGGGGGRGHSRLGPAWESWAGEGGYSGKSIQQPESHLILARKNRRQGSHLSSASYFGNLFWHLNLAGF
jgi:hypothetical protein